LFAAGLDAARAIAGTKKMAKTDTKQDECPLVIALSFGGWSKFRSSRHGARALSLGNEPVRLYYTLRLITEKEAIEIHAIF
jgi:hypothetical protein